MNKRIHSHILIQQINKSTHREANTEAKDALQIRSNEMKRCRTNKRMKEKMEHTQIMAGQVKCMLYFCVFGELSEQTMHTYEALDRNRDRE